VENLVPTGIRYRTVQPVVSRYTDWATRSTPKNILEWRTIANNTYSTLVFLSTPSSSISLSLHSSFRWIILGYLIL